MYKPAPAVDDKELGTFAVEAAARCVKLRELEGDTEQLKSLETVRDLFVELIKWRIWGKDK